MGVDIWSYCKIKDCELKRVLDFKSDKTDKFAFCYIKKELQNEPIYYMMKNKEFKHLVIYDVNEKKEKYPFALLSYASDKNDKFKNLKEYMETLADDRGVVTGLSSDVLNYEELGEYYINVPSNIASMQPRHMMGFIDVTRGFIKKYSK